jgi:hypothetical protein
VHLVQIDVVGAEPAKAGFAARHDVVARQTGVVGPVPHRHPHFGGDQHLVAAVSKHLADDLL